MKLKLIHPYKILTKKNLYKNTYTFLSNLKLNTQFLVVDIKMSYNNSKNKKKSSKNMKMELNLKIKISSFRTTLKFKYN